MAARLYNPPRPAAFRTIITRAGIVLGLIAVAVLVVYAEGGLIDSQKTGAGDGVVDSQDTGVENVHPDFLDCIYYALITITTVGYGDIVPGTTRARLVDVILLTPIRFIFIFTLLGTAYQLAFQRLQEGYLMSRAVGKLKNHTIVCGFGATGNAAVREMLLQGNDPEQIVVIEPDEIALQDTIDLPIVALQGDATKESVLGSAAIKEAAHIIITPGRDDTAVLIALTTRALNDKAQSIAACRAPENIKLLKHTGAHVIISPATAGGNLMAAATRRPHLAETLQEVLTVGGELRIDERRVRDAEVGMKPSELKDVVVLRVYRGRTVIEVTDVPVFEKDDAIVSVTRGVSA